MIAAIPPPDSVAEAYPFQFAASSSPATWSEPGIEFGLVVGICKPAKHELNSLMHSDLVSEYRRMLRQDYRKWRVTEANAKFKVCTLPSFLR